MDLIKVLLLFQNKITRHISLQSIYGTIASYQTAFENTTVGYYLIHFSVIRLDAICLLLVQAECFIRVHIRFFVRKAFHHVAWNHDLKACAMAIILASRFSDLISCRNFLKFQSWWFREASDSAYTILFWHDKHVRLVFGTSADLDIILFFFDWTILVWCRVQLWC